MRFRSKKKANYDSELSERSSTLLEKIGGPF